MQCSCSDASPAQGSCKWAQSTALGKPIGDGCYACYKTAVCVYPSLGWAGVCQTADVSATFKEKLLKEDVVHLSVRSDEIESRCDSAASVVKCKETDFTTYVDLGLLTEAEVVTMFGVSYDKLSLVPVTADKPVRNEEGEPFKEKVFVIGLPRTQLPAPSSSHV